MYSRIVNPKTGRRISITGKLGKTILRNYINILMGGAGGSDADGTPFDYLCPITLEIMVDPVMTSDGDTYERAAIEEWFSLGNTTSPRTRRSLPNQNLISNNTLRRVIEGWREQQPAPVVAAAPAPVVAAAPAPVVAAAPAPVVAAAPAPHPGYTPQPVDEARDIRLRAAAARVAERTAARRAWDGNDRTWAWGRYGCPMCGSHGPGCGYCQ